MMFVILFASCALIVYMVLAGTLQRQKQLAIRYNYQLRTTHFHCVKMIQIWFSTLLLLDRLAKSLWWPARIAAYFRVHSDGSFLVGVRFQISPAHLFSNHLPRE